MVKRILIVVLSLMGICAVLSMVSAIRNSTLPEHSSIVERLNKNDKIRMAEALHLREWLGEAVFPGWGKADIPVILYNEEYAFLLGYSDPPGGWLKVPMGIERGRAWELVTGDSWIGQLYYRQRYSDPGVTPESFTVMVGDRWVASLATLDWMQIRLTHQIREDLPPALRPIFPYSLFIGQLVNGSDQYISMTLHEVFHSYQGMMTPQKLADAELITQYAEQYPWEDQALKSDWQDELDVLAKALRSTDSIRTAELAGQFLALRATRRESAGLSPDLIAFEQEREWLEGLARYVELEIWRQAAAGDYAPLSETRTLTDFQNYRGFERRWSRELDQLRRMANDSGDGRLYYTGMAQAYLLDRLMPDWKKDALQEGVWLEDLLAKAVHP